GDGMDDLVWVAQKGSDFIRTIYLSNGNSFTSQGYEVDRESDFSEITQSEYQLHDVNGDGKMDLVSTYHYQNKIAWSVYLSYEDSEGKVAYGKISRSTDASFTPDFYQHNRFILADVDGDGRADMIYTFFIQGVMARVLYLANPNGSGYTKAS